MKKILLFALVGIFIMASCDKEETITYQQEAGLYFSTKEDKDTTNFSFTKVATDKHVVKIPVKISGSTVAKDRSFQVKVTKGDALKETFKIQKCLVSKDSTTGHVFVELTKNDAMNEKTFFINLKLESSKDFPLVNIAQDEHILRFTNQFIKPSLWDVYISRYLGQKYSENYHKFIADVTGDLDLEDSMPEGLKKKIEQWGLENGIQYYWKRYPDMDLLDDRDKVRAALLRYNTDNPNNHLKHNDGSKVEMP